MKIIKFEEIYFDYNDMFWQAIDEKYKAIIKTKKNDGSVNPDLYGVDFYFIEENTC